jgi:hypothetical protein
MMVHSCTKQTQHLLTIIRFRRPLVFLKFNVITVFSAPIVFAPVTLHLTLAAQRRKDEAKEARMEAMRKEAIMMKKRAVIDKYLATCHLSNNKVCAVAHYFFSVAALSGNLFMHHGLMFFAPL